jgi:hypothetical protein
VSNGSGRPTGAVRLLAAAIGAGSLDAFLGALFIAFLSATFLGVSAAPAGAHTALKATSPKDGGKIDAAPRELLLEFTKPLLGAAGARIVVAGPDGAQYQQGAPLIINSIKLTQQLKPLGPAGEYRVEFRVVAYDGHPLTSGIRFTLTKPGPAAGGSKKVVQLAPFAEVSSSVNNAPPWESWVGAAAVVVLVSGAVLFGRRVTRDLDQ